jgi:hypothetical protein
MILGVFLPIASTPVLSSATIRLIVVLVAIGSIIVKIDMCCIEYLCTYAELVAKFYFVLYPPIASIRVDTRG